MSAAPDVLVVGDGPAGASAALGLASKGVAVWLVSSNKKSPAPPAETLPPVVKNELAKLGARRSVLGAIPSYGIEAHWGDAVQFRSHVFDAHGNGLHIDHASFTSGLIVQALQAGVRLLSSMTLDTLKRSGEQWEVRLSGASAQEFKCAFVVDATGRSSATARFLRIRRQRVDALCGVGSVSASNSTRSTLRVESAPYGWWYTSPTPDGKQLVCLMSDVDIIRSLRANQSTVWNALLSTTTFGQDVIGPVTQLQVLPCESSMLESAAERGWVAVGDAACVFDPLSSAGIVKAIHNARVAGDYITETLDGRPHRLGEYGDQVRLDFEHYLATRCSQYQLETRWVDEIFWRRRQTGRSLSSKAYKPLVAHSNATAMSYRSVSVSKFLKSSRAPRQ